MQRRSREGDTVLVQDVFSSLTQHLQELASPDSCECFAAAAKLIASAERVFCLGLRSSFSVAYIFHYVQSLFGTASVLVDGAGGTGIDVLRTSGAADVMLAITVNPYNRYTVRAARYARERGMRIVAVTDSEMSPLAALADETLIVRTETPSFFHTMAVAFAAVECLAALVAARRGARTLAAIAASEKHLAAFDVFLVASQKRRSQS
jgi:DNA-binding MurR/RpiR family transcriptional regulator